MDNRFSVLIPVYYKEKPEYFSEALASVINQTLKPNEIVVVKDGPLTEDLEEVLSKYDIENPGLFKIVVLESNQGLGVALAKGVEECSYELIARMDSDDISRNDRFEKQIAEFEKDPDLDICGSQIAEFEGTVENVVSHRRVPLKDSEIKRFQKMRSAFNHPSVMYKKSSVIEAGNYLPFQYMQDGMLYVQLFQKEAKGVNLPQELLYFRISNDFFQRRGGIYYYHQYKQVRKVMKDKGYISVLEYNTSLALHFIVAIMPMSLRGIIYRTFLHQPR